MAANSLYCSQEEAREFWVTVQKTEAAERCRLHGAYLLKASRDDGLVLQDPHSHQPLYTWPYRLLRRYGRDKVMFSFEAGRRCESGPGNFTFETKQGNEIFHVVEAAIQEQKAQVEEKRQSGSSLDTETSGMARVPSTIAHKLLLESGGLSERQEPRSILGTTLSLAMEEKEGAVSPLRGPGPQDPLPQWPTTPPRTPLSGLVGLPVASEDTGSVYSEPLDAVKGPRYMPDPLYADPLDSRDKQQEEAGLGRTGPLYEQVRPVSSSSAQGARGHIYDEPEGRAPPPVPAPTPIYDEAHLPREAWRTQGLEHQAGYEVLHRPGAADYAAGPAFSQNQGLKLPKPSPAPKPPRMHKKPPPGLDRALHKNGPSSNNNHQQQQQQQEGDGELIYSWGLKPPRACRGPGGREQSVDESRPASVYEDLGEI